MCFYVDFKCKNDTKIFTKIKVYFIDFVRATSDIFL